MVPPGSELFGFTPFSPSITPNLLAILDIQVVNPAIAEKVFAEYPGEDGSFRRVSYREYADLLERSAFTIYNKLLPLLRNPRHVPFPGEPKSDAPVVAVLVDNGFPLAVLIMALMKLNITVLVLAPSNSGPAIMSLIKECSAQVIIHSQGHTKLATESALDCSIGRVEFDLTQLTSVHDPTNFAAAKTMCQTLYPSHPDIPIIVHSSGSTGFPKPVYWSNASFLANSQVMLLGCGVPGFKNPSAKFLCLGPLYHTLGLTIGLGGAICAGSTIVFPLTKTWPPSPTDLIKTFQATEVTTSVIVPLLLEQLVDALESQTTPHNPYECLSRLDIVITGGAHCPERLARRLVSHGVNLTNIYGSSETGHLMIGAHNPFVSTDIGSWKLVRPFPHTSVILKPVETGHLKRTFQVHVSRDDPRLAYGVISPEEETWDTGDVIQESTPVSEWYELLYRNDDILVHVSGEKTNPVLMETICRSHPIVDCIAILGHTRRVTCALVQLNESIASGLGGQERRRLVFDAIADANHAAPTHSRVVEEMILILPIESGKKIPRSPKGNCIRPKVLEEFADDIQRLYVAFEGSDNTPGDILMVQPQRTRLDEVERDVRALLADIIGTHERALNPARSLFEIGLDSITVMRLRKRLSNDFGINVTAQLIYQNFSLDRLTLAVYRLLNPSAIPASVPVYDSRQTIIARLLERQLSSLSACSGVVLSSRIFLHSKASIQSMSLNLGQVVAVVGACGSLGIQQVKAILDRPDVHQVVCMVRGKDVATIYDRLSGAFSKTGLTEEACRCIAFKRSQLDHPGIPVVELDQRLVVLPFDFQKPGLNGQEYLALATHLTTIIHCGWKMDFNQTVLDFETDCLSGTMQLLILAAFIRPKHFYFISSIGTVMESSNFPAPETLEKWKEGHHISASPHGYSESKFIAEQMIGAASKLLELPCSIARVGQITGDSVNGVWKTQEMNPIIIAGSAGVGRFPISGDFVDWIPVDVVARSTVELALARSSTESSFEVAVHHIANPTLSSYESLCSHLQDSGVKVEPTSVDKWWSCIKADQGNPCLALEAYIEETFVNGERMNANRRVLDLSRTLGNSEALASCPVLDGTLWKKYVGHWLDIGFLPR